MKALRGCQRLAVGTTPPYNRSAELIHLIVGGYNEFASAAFQKRRTG